MANARVKFYLYDCTTPEFPELEGNLMEMLDSFGYRLSGRIHIDDAMDRRQTPAVTWKGEERRRC